MHGHTPFLIFSTKLYVTCSGSMYIKHQCLYFIMPCKMNHKWHTLSAAAAAPAVLMSGRSQAWAERSVAFLCARNAHSGGGQASHALACSIRSADARHAFTDHTNWL